MLGKSPKLYVKDIIHPTQQDPMTAGGGNSLLIHPICDLIQIIIKLHIACVLMLDPVLVVLILFTTVLRKTATPMVYGETTQCLWNRKEVQANQT